MINNKTMSSSSLYEDLVWGKHSAKQQKTLHLLPAESLIAPCTLSPPVEEGLTFSVPLLLQSKARFSFTSLNQPLSC